MLHMAFNVYLSRFSINHRCGVFFHCMFMKGMQLS